jgi:hypothetical protein
VWSRHLHAGTGPSGDATPLVLVQHDSDWPRRQAPIHCRSRICLLKGCERRFSPRHPLGRYCSSACREAARRWSLWQAGRRYRASVRGKACRRRQACRYRERVRQRREGESAGPPVPREGHQDAANSEKIPCSRPGCYELFSPPCRSPLKRFCSCLCREALRRVRRREARWGHRRDSPFAHDRPERSDGPFAEVG